MLSNANKKNRTYSFVDRCSYQPVYSVVTPDENGNPTISVTEERPTINDGISASSFSARSVLRSGVQLVPTKNPSVLNDGVRGRDLIDAVPLPQLTKPKSNSKSNS